MSTSATVCTTSSAVRAEADRMAADGRGDRFRRRRLEHSKDGEGLVLTAVRRAKAGDQDAIRFLYLRYADNVYGYVCSIVRDEHEAEDVTQQVFAKLMTVLHKYEQRDVPFAAWILRVSRNVAVDHMRGRRAIPCEEVRALGRGEDEESVRQLSLTLREALATLTEDQREVLVLRHIAGLSPLEIASRLDKSEGAVHGLHHRGRGALRSALEGLGAAPVTAAA